MSAFDPLRTLDRPRLPAGDLTKLGLAVHLTLRKMEQRPNADFSNSARSIDAPVHCACAARCDFPPATQSVRPANLDIHNRERTAVGGRPLRWNVGLAARAQDYANRLARTGQLAHASRAGRGIERENLNRGLPGWNTDQMMGNWLNEKRNFTPGTFPNVSRTGNWYDVGHYSQMIWPTTTDIGCGWPRDAVPSGSSAAIRPAATGTASWWGRRYIVRPAERRARSIPPNPHSCGRQVNGTGDPTWRCSATPRNVASIPVAAARQRCRVRGPSKGD